MSLRGRCVANLRYGVVPSEGCYIPQLLTHQTNENVEVESNLDDLVRGRENCGDALQRQGVLRSAVCMASIIMPALSTLTATFKSLLSA
jgi:hypothetical protein